ncbi:hypothetical protein [Pantoea agglomerans]
MTMTMTMISVYADWSGLKQPKRLGYLHIRRSRAREVAPYFRLKTSEAETIIENFSSIVAQWRVVARHLGLSQREQEKMSDAFRLAAAHSA